MKTMTLRNWLAAIVVLLCSTSALAYNLKDGIYYYLDSDTKTAMVTAPPYNKKYEGGDVVIREHIWQGEEKYPVTSIAGNAFGGCTGLTSISLPSSLTSIGVGAFYGCTSLTEIHLPKSLINVGAGAFSGCTGIKTVTMQNSVMHIAESCFGGCTGITSITIPESVVKISEKAFYGCENLKLVINHSKLILKKGETSNGHIGYYADNVINGGEQNGDFFFYTKNGINYLCGYIGTDKEIRFPENHNGQSYEIADYAFCNKHEIVDLIFPNSVTKIGKEAFSNCDGLTNITLPESISDIGVSAFSDCI